jgi:hypothetical protein
MAFRTKLDFSDNRQVKQHIITKTVLSGATSFGVPYSDLPSGPNLSTSSVTQTITSIVSTFSGNGTTTNYTWYDSRMSLANNAFSAITPTTSAYTQNSGQIYTGNTYTIIDSNTIYSSYTGVSFDISATTVVNLGGGNYSGSVYTNTLRILLANSSDFTGRTIWNDVSGITRTKDLIITNLAAPGFVWTCSDTEGKGAWGPVSAATTTDYWISGSTGIKSLKTFNGSGLDATGNYALAQNFNTQAIGYASHAGGYNSIVRGDYGFIHSNASTIGTGSTDSAILGGNNNNLYISTYSGIFAGKNNTISGGTSGNTLNMILGGNNNLINNHANSFIIGGSGNTIHFDLDAVIATNNFEQIINSRDSSISASTNVEINNSVDVSIGDNILSSIRNSYSYSYNTNITGTYSPINTSAFNLIDTSVDSGITGYTFRNIIMGSYNAHIYGTSSGANSYGNVIMGCYDVKLIGSFENYNTTTLSSEEIEYRRNFYTIVGASSEVTILTGSYLTILGVRTANIEKSNTSAILGGRNHTLKNVDNSVIIGGENITASTSDTVYVPNMVVSTGGTDSKLGVNKYPDYVIDVLGNSSRLYMKPTTSSTFDGARQMIYSGATNTSPQYVLTDGVVDIGIGVRGTNTSNTTYMQGLGITGDTFICSSAAANGLNIAQFDTIPTNNKPHYIRFYAGQTATSSNTADIHIQGTTSGSTTRGYVGIGLDSPTMKLDVNGNAKFRSVGSTNSGNVSLFITSTGELSTTGSDERLKKDIITIDSALDKIKNLRGVYYKWKTGDTENHVGFIAQEVKEVMPELTYVNNNSPEKYMGVHYQDVTALLVEAIKELASGQTTNNAYLETQTILAEDNNIDLNYNGSVESAVGGGIRVLNAIGVDKPAELITDIDGNFITNNDFKPNSLTIPIYTPTSSNDINGNEGNITRDSDYLYVKCNNIWKRTKLEEF